MIESIQQLVVKTIRAFVLRGYGWKRRKSIRLGRPTMQWRDPMSLLWYSEHTAMKLLKVQAMDEYRRD